jgi:hypothetical protein
MSENSEWMARIFSKAAQPTEADHARALDMTIRAMARDQYNPNALNPPQTVRVANAPIVQTVGEGRGFIELKPLESPSAKGSTVDRVIAGMCEEQVKSFGLDKDNGGAGC